MPPILPGIAMRATARRKRSKEALDEIDGASRDRQKIIGEIDEQQAQLDEQIESSLSKLRKLSAD
ncbi:MAG: hypothetical protein ACJ75Q_01815 [Gaiellaceae bacterium]